ncbi:MAG: protein jag, partial [Firmicutes bacterium]|nr:protein jag [Bacillota bacterium]
ETAPKPQEKTAAKSAAKQTRQQKPKSAKPKKQPEKKLPEKKVTRKITKADINTPCGKAEDFLNELFAAMNVDIEVNAELEEPDSLMINLTGDNMGIVIGKRGDTLDSIQYLTSLVVNRGQDDYIRVTIDTENYRKKRTEALESLAGRIAAKVVRTGRKFTLEPMNPYERRVIHANLQNYSGVTTFSVGKEPYRKVVIAPENAKPRYDKRDRGDRRYSKRGSENGGNKERSDKPSDSAKKVGSYKTTYKADFKATPHKAEYKNYEEYLAAQHGEIVPPMGTGSDE